MKANSETIYKILSGNGSDSIYRIPPYQRAYAWGKSEWEELFNDLYDNTEGYFLGSLICINSADNKEFTVIDGQQRLTTLSILMLSIYSCIDNLRKEIKFEFADDYAKNKMFLWLREAICRDANAEVLTLNPSIQNKNNSDWNYLVKKIFNIPFNISLEKEKEISNWGNRRISKAFDHFNKLIENSSIYNKNIKERCDNKDIFNNLFLFLEKVIKAEVIKIETDNEQSAFLLFESLNNRGVPLSAIDLIKNKILSKLGGNLAKNNEEWQKIVNNIGDKPNLQERFLRHYYMVYVKTGERVTKSNLIDLYSKYINDNKDIVNIFNELVNKSKTHGLLINPENINESNWMKYKRKLTNIKYLGVSSSYMLLTYLFDKYKDEDFTDLLDYLEFWFICRHLTNTPPTNELDKIFEELVKTQEKEYNFEKIKSELDFYINIKNIKTALKAEDLYENTPLARAILIRLEDAKRNKQTDVDFWAITNKKLTWSIEHIYPQNPKDPNDWGNDEANSNLKALLHSLGNLTLTGYNSTYSNKSYFEKCNAKDDKKPVGLKNGNVNINEMLPEPDKDKNTWTSYKIQRRTVALIKDFLSFLDKK